MIYKKVSRIKEPISAIAIGCWNFGGDWDCSDDQNTETIVNKAVDMGINFLDVAPVYGWGHSEEVLGRVLRASHLRDKVIIASKAGLLWDEHHKTRNNLSKASLMEECEASLRRLQTDHIDIYQMHWPDPSVPLEETAEALAELKAAGKIRYIGLSNFAQKDMEKMMDMVGVDCQQGLYNMFERNTDTYHGIPLAYRTEKEVLPNVLKYGQAYLPYSPLFQGLLAGKFNNGITFSSRDIRNENPKLTGAAFEMYRQAAVKLQTLADSFGVPMNEIALNWLIQNPAITTIIGGVSSEKQLEQNVHCMSWSIDETMMRKIDEIIEPFREI